jgi:hypothetical protein
MIRLYSEHRKPGPDAPLTEGQEEMKELAGLRALYQKQEGMLRGALESAGSACAVKSVKASLTSVERQISRLEARLEELRDADAKRAAVCAELTKIAGVGDLTALLVTSLVPELGTLSRRRSASLAGLAPHPEDSGICPHGPRGGEGVEGSGRNAPLGYGIGTARRTLLKQCAAPRVTQRAAAPSLFLLPPTPPNFYYPPSPSDVFFSYPKKNVGKTVDYPLTRRPVR